ncbi:hypothetical protein WJX77_005789 [Trebouxia sp. C0004]
MAIWTAPKAAQNATDIETPDIPESEGGKGRGRGGAKGARTGATSGRGSYAVLLQQVHGADGFEEAEMNE